MDREEIFTWIGIMVVVGFVMAVLVFGYKDLYVPAVFEDSVYDQTPIIKQDVPKIVQETIKDFIDDCIVGDDPLCECHEAINHCYDLENEEIMHDCRILAASAMNECYKTRETGDKK